MKIEPDKIVYLARQENVKKIEDLFKVMIQSVVEELKKVTREINGPHEIEFTNLEADVADVLL